MGYRSEVVLAIDAKLVPALMTVFAKCEATQKLCTQECDELDTDYDGDGNWFMRWDGIKWYESYPEIAMLTSFVEAIESDDLTEFGIKALDDHDGEVKGYCFESIGISRSIHY